MSLLIEQGEAVTAEMDNDLFMVIHHHTVTGDLYFQGYAVIDFATIHSDCDLVQDMEVTLTTDKQKQIVKDLFVQASCYSSDSVFFSLDEAFAKNAEWVADYEEQLIWEAECVA